MFLKCDKPQSLAFLNGILQGKLKNHFPNFIQQEIVSGFIVLSLWRSTQTQAIAIRRESARKMFDERIRASSVYFVKTNSVSLR